MAWFAWHGDRVPQLGPNSPPLPFFAGWGLASSDQCRDVYLISVDVWRNIDLPESQAIGRTPAKHPADELFPFAVEGTNALCVDCRPGRTAEVYADSAYAYPKRAAASLESLIEMVVRILADDRTVFDARML